MSFEELLFCGDSVLMCLEPWEGHCTLPKIQKGIHAPLDQQRPKDAAWQWACLTEWSSWDVLLELDICTGTYWYVQSRTMPTYLSTCTSHRLIQASTYS